MTRLLAELLHRADKCRRCPQPRPPARDVVEGKEVPVALMCDSCRTTLGTLKSIVARTEN